jgi:uncharacterized protein (DUF1015 family)
MADLRPFAAWRPRPDCAARLCELPYDVVSAAEARQLAAGNPLSFFHVSRPEVDLPLTSDPYAPEVYRRGRENFLRLIADGALVRDPSPAYYLYRQASGARCQTGLVALASCDEYRRGVVRKHELTRREKEDDRARHIAALDAQTGPAFLAYRAQPELDQYLEERTAGEPAIDFAAPDGVRHSAWVIADTAGLACIQAGTRQIPRLYIADGHHRTAAAARVNDLRRGEAGSEYFLAVAFPHDRLRVLPYHRVVKDLNGLSPESLRRRLETVLEPCPGGAAQPPQPRQIGFYLSGAWQRLRFRPALTEGTEGIAALDVALLQRHVLGPIFGIDDPRASPRLGFVGGIRGTGELERLVDAGTYACAFALYPTGVEQLLAIADAGGVMPPKSTWFDPKLRDGMFSYRLA